MTICISWLRKTNNLEELVFISDSRLRSYGAWDANPKIFPLDRTDCAICFAGDTQYSYPLMIQIQNAIKSFKMSQSRFQDLTHFKGHLLNIMNSMLLFKSDYEEPLVRFIFGGYSWQNERFLLWNIFYDKKSKLFVAAKVKPWKGIKSDRFISVIGDYTDIFYDKLKILLGKKNKFTSGNFDMEPLEALTAMLIENKESSSHEKYPDIGGAPQLLKVYKHLNVLPIAVKWNFNGEDFVALSGRPLQVYELTSYPIIDTKTMIIENINPLGKNIKI